LVRTKAALDRDSNRDLSLQTILGHGFTTISWGRIVRYEVMQAKDRRNEHEPETAHKAR
jgi:hypothetical protein